MKHITGVDHSVILVRDIDKSARGSCQVVDGRVSVTLNEGRHRESLCAGHRTPARELGIRDG